MGVRTTLYAIGWAFTFILSGCGQEKNSPAAANVSATNAVSQSSTQIFVVRGVIKEFRPQEKEVVIKHEKIPNYMEAMTMPFPVKSTNEFAGLHTNDQIVFTMVVSKKDGWVQDLKKVGTETNSMGTPPRPAMRLVRDVQPLKIGDPMPDYAFTNSFGRVVKLSDFKGQAYAFTFMFTRCPFPTFCPRMSSNFSDTYKILTSDTNAPPNWHLLTVSFDPDFDTPERLKEYSEVYHPDLKKWDFLTGAQLDIDAIADQVGLVFAYEKGTFNHNLRTTVVDKNGKLRAILRGNDWKPQELTDELIAGAKGEQIPNDRVGQTGE